VRELQQRMSSSEFAEWCARARVKADEAEQAEMAARVEQRMRARK